MASDACSRGGTLLDQEPYNEVIATELFSRLLSEDDYVPYTLIEWGGAPVSSCPNFVGPTEEFIPAYYVNEVLPSAPHRDSYRHYVECCAALGVEGIETALGKMILCDDIMANTTATGVTSASSAMWKPLSIALLPYSTLARASGAACPRESWPTRPSWWTCAPFTKMRIDSFAL